MKIFKVIIAVAVVTLSILGFSYYQDTYAGQDYYVKITRSVPKSDSLDKDGKKMGEAYEYKVTGFSEKGEARKLDFSWQGDNAIPVNTWLKVSASKKRVISQTTIKQNEVPQVVQDKY